MISTVLVILVILNTISAQCNHLNPLKYNTITINSTLLNISREMFNNTDYERVEDIKIINWNLCHEKEHFWEKNDEDLKWSNVETDQIPVYIEERTFWDMINLKSLSLSYNSLSTLHPNTFIYLKKLDKLILSNNNLNKFDKTIFANLSSIKYLDLSENKIQKLDQHLFLSLHELEVLNLWKNSIVTLDEGVFSSLISLRYLDLGFNQISQLAPGIFKTNSQLNRLQLNSNNLLAIENGVFNDLELLLKLDVSFNRIKELRSNTFEKLVSLEQLDLSNNDITSIALGTFDQLKGLQDLNLNWNLLSELTDSLFIELNSLHSLQLSNNKIEQIPADVFPKSLTALHLDFNKLTTLDASIILKLDGLTQVFLQGNPWICDCNLGELYDYPGLDTNRTKCVAPRLFKNRNWNTLTPNLFDCKPIVSIVQSNVSAENVQLACKVIASPQPMIQWIYNNESVQFEYLNHGIKLISWLNITVPKTTMANGTEYLCRAMNTEGTTEIRAVFRHEIALFNTKMGADIGMCIFIGFSVLVLVILLLLLLKWCLRIKHAK